MADTLADLTREADRDRRERLRLLADPDCDRCHGFGRSSSNYVTPGKYGELTCPCTGAAPWQSPALLDAPIPFTRDERAA